MISHRFVRSKFRFASQLRSFVLPLSPLSPHFQHLFHQRLSLLDACFGSRIFTNSILFRRTSRFASPSFRFLRFDSRSTSSCSRVDSPTPICSKRRRTFRGPRQEEEVSFVLSFPSTSHIHYVALKVVASQSQQALQITPITLIQLIPFSLLLVFVRKGRERFNSGSTANFDTRIRPSGSSSEGKEGSADRTWEV